MDKNSKRLESFTKYCKEHPEMRFFQALRNWLNVDAVLVEDNGEIKDTFYQEQED